MTPRVFDAVADYAAQRGGLKDSFRPSTFPASNLWTGLGQVSTYTWLHLLTFKHTWPTRAVGVNVGLKAT